MRGSRDRFGAATLAAGCAAALLVAGVATSPVEARLTRTCMGYAATIVGSIGDDTIVGTKGPDVIVSLGGVDDVQSKGGADKVCSGAGDDTVQAGAGANRVDGGPGSDILLGGGAADQLAGGDGFDALLALAGNDQYIGGAGLDIAAFLASPVGVTADLASGTASGEGADTMTGIEALMGSDHADHLLGNGVLNALFSGLGADVLDGRGGNDFVFLSNAPGPVEIDLGDDKYTGGGLARRIENVVGSPYDDVIYGDSSYSYLDGAEGVDAVDGIDGSDTCIAETVFNCRPVVPVEAGADTPPPPDATPAARLTTVESDGPPPPPTGQQAPTSARRVDQPSQYGYTNCPMLQSSANIGTFLNGTVQFASQHSYDENWYFSTYVFLNDSQWWYWQNNAWHGPYSKDTPQWSQAINAGDVAWGWAYSWDIHQWYPLGNCNSNALMPGFS